VLRPRRHLSWAGQIKAGGASTSGLAKPVRRPSSASNSDGPPQLIVSSLSDELSDNRPGLGQTRADSRGQLPASPCGTGRGHPRVALPSGRRSRLSSDPAPSVWSIKQSHGAPAWQREVVGGPRYALNHLRCGPPDTKDVVATTAPIEVYLKVSSGTAVSAKAVDDW
jgi:hypothetical protein